MVYEPWIVRYKCLRCWEVREWDVKYSDAHFAKDDQTKMAARNWQVKNGKMFPRDFKCPECGFHVLVKPRPQGFKMVDCE